MTPWKTAFSCTQQPLAIGSYLDPTERPRTPPLSLRSILNYPPVYVYIFQVIPFVFTNEIIREVLISPMPAGYIRLCR